MMPPAGNTTRKAGEMSLTAAAQNGPKPARKGPLCSIGRLMQKLPDDERAALYIILTDPDWQHSDIGRVLREDGFDIGDPTIARHRKGRCKCDPIEHGTLDDAA